MKQLSDIIKSKSITSDHRNKHEFQAYGNRLSEEFNDPRHRALYIKLAKTEDRNLMEVAREFVMRQEGAVTKGRLFMWKLKQLKDGQKEKAIEKTEDKVE